MSTDAEKILESAMKLPSEARAALAGSLIESLDEQTDEDAEAAWSAEIARRLREIDEGKVKAVPWTKARLEILTGPDEPG